MSDPIIYPPDLLERAARIKLLLMDCDGVLSDGHIFWIHIGELRRHVDSLLECD